MKELTIDEINFVGGGADSPISTISALKTVWDLSTWVGGKINGSINYYVNYMTSDAWAYYHQGGYSTGWSAYIC